MGEVIPKSSNIVSHRKISEISQTTRGWGVLFLTPPRKFPDSVQICHHYLTHLQLGKKQKSETPNPEPQTPKLFEQKSRRIKKKNQKKKLRFQLRWCVTLGSNTIIISNLYVVLMGYMFFHGYKYEKDPRVLESVNRQTPSPKYLKV